MYPAIATYGTAPVRVEIDTSGGPFIRAACANQGTHDEQMTQTTHLHAKNKNTWRSVAFCVKIKVAVRAAIPATTISIHDAIFICQAKCVLWGTTASISVLKSLTLMFSVLPTLQNRNDSEHAATPNWKARCFKNCCGISLLGSVDASAQNVYYIFNLSIVGIPGSQ